MIAFLAAISLSWYAFNLHDQVVLKETQLVSLTDTLTLYKTKTGASGAKRRIFTGTKSEVLSVLKSGDKQAYNIVKQTPNLRYYTDFTTVTKFDTIVRADTVYITKDSVGKVDFQWRKRIVEPHGFYRARLKIHNDSVKLKVQMFDKFHITSKDKSNGFFKPKSTIINVENQNPYVRIDSLKSFEFKPKNKVKKGFKIGSIIAVAIGAFLLLKK